MEIFKFFKICVCKHSLIWPLPLSSLIIYHCHSLIIRFVQNGHSMFSVTIVQLSQNMHTCSCASIQAISKMNRRKYPRWYPCQMARYIRVANWAPTLLFIHRIRRNKWLKGVQVTIFNGITPVWNRVFSRLSKEMGRYYQVVSSMHQHIHTSWRKCSFRRWMIRRQKCNPFPIPICQYGDHEFHPIYKGNNIFLVSIPIHTCLLPSHPFHYTRFQPEWPLLQWSTMQHSICTLWDGTRWLPMSNARRMTDSKRRIFNRRKIF